MNEIELLQNPEFAIDTKARGALDIANRLIIDSDSARIDAGTFIKICKSLQAEVKKDREDERVAARATVDAILAARKRHLDPLEKAELITKTKVLAYDEGEAQKRREEQARLVAEAQHEAEEAAIRRAKELDAAGDYDGADALLDMPVEASPPVVLPDMTPKLDGQHIVTRWKCRLVDKAILIQGAHEDPYYGDLLEFDETRANEMVKRIRDSLAYKTKEGRISVNHGKINAINELPAKTVLTKEMIGESIPGVEVYLEKSMASTAWK